MNRQVRHDNKIYHTYWTVLFTTNLSPKYIVVVLSCYLLGYFRRHVMYDWWHAKAYADDIRLWGQLAVLEEDILLDRKGARYVRYLSSGTGCGVHAAAANSEQSLRTQQTEEGLQWIYQMLTTTGCNNCLYCIISSTAIRPWCVHIQHDDHMKLTTSMFKDQISFCLVSKSAWVIQASATSPSAEDPTSSRRRCESLICWYSYRLNNIEANNKLLPLKRFG